MRVVLRIWVWARVRARGGIWHERLRLVCVRVCESLDDRALLRVHFPKPTPDRTHRRQLHAIYPAAAVVEQFDLVVGALVVLKSLRLVSSLLVLCRSQSTWRRFPFSRFP